MGAWQAWYAVDGSPGNYARHRETVVHPLNGGKDCPPCTEYKKGTSLKYILVLHQLETISESNSAKCIYFIVTNSARAVKLSTISSMHYMMLGAIKVGLSAVPRHVNDDIIYISY